MKRNFLHIPFLAVLLTMTSCSQDEEGNVTYDSEKTPILFTVGQTGVSPLTRTVVSGGEPARAFTKDTRLFLYMEAEKDGAAKKKWGCNYGTAAGVADAADGSKSAVAFSGNYLYWDDAFARDTKLTVYSLAMANSMAESMTTTSPDVTLNATTSRFPFTEETTDISPTVSITLGKDNKQDVTSVSQQDLVFSNNVSELSGDSRMKYNQGTKLFDKGELVYNHALASMTFKLKAGDGFDGVYDFKFVDATGKPTGFELKGFYGMGTFNVKEGTFSSKDVVDFKDICHAATPTAETKAHTLKALLLPGSDMTAETEAVSFIIEGNKYVLTKAQLYNAIKANPANVEGDNVKEAVLAGGKCLKAGVNYEFVFRVSKTDIEITAAVKDWENVTAEEEEPLINVTTSVGDNTSGKQDAFTSFDFYLSDAASVNAETAYTQMSKATGTKTDGSEKWAFTSPLYWPNHATHYFMRGVFPTETTVTDGKITITNTTYDNQAFPSNLLVGAPVIDTGKMCGSDSHTPVDMSTHGVCAREATVNLTFNYMTTQIEVRLSTPDTGSDRVTLTNAKVEIVDGYTAGEVNIHDKSVAVTGNVTDYMLPHIATEDANCRHATVVPQSLTNSDRNDLRFRITLTGENGTTDIYYATIKNIKVKTSAEATSENITKWEPGKHYIYSLLMRKTKLEVSASIVDWIPVQGSDDVWF